MSKNYDKHKQEASDYKKGDLVMLDGRNIAVRRPSKKFSPKLHRPFEVIEKVKGNRNAIRLKIPARWRIHDVFHVSLLEPYRHGKSSGKRKPDLARVLVEAEEIVPSDEYLPRKIWNSVNKRHKGKLQILYWIEWEGYPDNKDFTWEPYEHLKDSTRALKLLTQFHQEYSDMLRHLQAG